MPPTLVLLVGLVYIGWTITRDRRWRRLPSGAMWIPGLWLAMSSSRPLEFWLAQLGVIGQQSSRIDGNPVNVVFNGGLLVAAVLVLKKRRFDWAKFAGANLALCAIYVFFLCSMLWSPYPVPTVKRVVQDFGSVLTGLIVLTEEDPAEAIRVLFVRLAFILFPLSVIFIRYFPEIGRTYSTVTGNQFLGGVTGHKNLLGQMTMVYCLVLLWDLQGGSRPGARERTEPERLIRMANMAIGLYLLLLSRSATSLMCFLFGVALLYGSRLLAGARYVRGVLVTGGVTLTSLLLFEQVFGISARISEMLGRGAGLSGRTEIWRAILEKHTGVVLGAGFMGFWETKVGESVWQELGMTHLITAHNGYLETYLHGGVVGVCLLVALVLASGVSAADKLRGREPVGTMSAVFWPLLLVYNVTESAFFLAGSLWFTTLLMVINGSPRGLRSERAPRRGGLTSRGPARVGPVSVSGPADLSIDTPPAAPITPPTGRRQWSRTGAPTRHVGRTRP
jgi:exopolysaccharide production protein ExoQ